jgi:hypothetical protein
MIHNKQYNGQMKKIKDKQWPITDNTMDKWKRQRTNIDPLQTIQWSNEKDKGQTMTHNRQYNGQMKKTKDKHWPITDNTIVKWKRQRTNIDP